MVETNKNKLQISKFQLVLLIKGYGKIKINELEISKSPLVLHPNPKLLIRPIGQVEFCVPRDIHVPVN